MWTFTNFKSFFRILNIVLFAASLCNTFTINTIVSRIKYPFLSFTYALQKPTHMSLKLPSTLFTTKSIKETAPCKEASRANLVLSSYPWHGSNSVTFFKYFFYVWFTIEDVTLHTNISCTVRWKKEKNRERQEIKRKENMYKKHSRKFMNQLKTRTGLMYGSITTGDDSPMLFPKPNMNYDSNWNPDQFQQEWDEEMDTYYREQETSRIFRDGQGEFLVAVWWSLPIKNKPDPCARDRLVISLQNSRKKHGPNYTHFMGIFTPVLFPKMNLITKNETVNRDGTTFRRVFWHSFHSEAVSGCLILSLF